MLARKKLKNLAVFINILIYSFYTQTLLWGVLAAALIMVFMALLAMNKHLGQNFMRNLKFTIPILIGIIIYAFYLQVLIFGVIIAVLILIISVSASAIDRSAIDI
jgi:hypothetical protein